MKKPVLSLLIALTVTISMTVSSFGANVARNTKFTTVSTMKQSLGTSDSTVWNPVYLTEVENTYWTFSNQNALGGTSITIDIAKNCYRNLEMLLDNGYTMDYNTLKSYSQEYLSKKNGVPDAFYSTLNSCLGNPYLLNKPEATVTATTYNGRDYSKVFDAAFYLSAHPELAATIGNNPAELLRHFVEVGVTNGYQGNAAFNVASYALTVDAQVMKNQASSASYLSLGPGHPQPVGRYSYSWANYYGKYLGHYSSAPAVATAPAGAQGIDPSTITDIDTQGPDGGEDNSVPIPKTVTGVYNEASTVSVYTGEPVSAARANTRPLAVMMPTDKAAQPSYGISKADILYEIMEEGGISRQMAIIPDWTGMNRIGNLRSCRLYYIYAAKEWDPILIHFGGVAYMKGVINAADMNNLSGTYEYGVGGKAPGAGYFFRSNDRSAPHNAYISASGVQKACVQQGYSLNLRAGYYNPNHFTFADGVNDLSGYANALPASHIDLSGIYPYSKSSFNYNASQGVYYKNIHGGPQKDALTGTQISFANVIIQNTKWSQLDKKGYLGFTMIDSSEDGYYFTKGRCIHITWRKTSDYAPTRYYDDAGNEIKLNRGKTYIGVAQKGHSPVFN